MSQCGPKNEAQNTRPDQPALSACPVVFSLDRNSMIAIEIEHRYEHVEEVKPTLKGKAQITVQERGHDNCQHEFAQIGQKWAGSGIN
jgi:hypothetical protein